MTKVEKFLDVVRKNVHGDHKIEVEEEDNGYIVKVDGKNMNVSWSEEAEKKLDMINPLHISAQKEAAKIVAMEINRELNK